MAERLEVLRSIAQEYNIPIAATCTATDILRILLAEFACVDQGEDDCFGYMFAQKREEGECATCTLLSLCKRISEVPPGPDDETLKRLKFVSPNLTVYGFNRGTQGHAVVELLLIKPRTTDEICKFLEQKFESDSKKSHQMWNYIKESLKKNGFEIVFDSVTKLNTFVDPHKSEVAHVSN